MGRILSNERLGRRVLEAWIESVYKGNVHSITYDDVSMVWDSLSQKKKRQLVVDAIVASREISQEMAEQLAICKPKMFYAINTMERHKPISLDEYVGLWVEGAYVDSTHEDIDHVVFFLFALAHAGDYVRRHEREYWRDLRATPCSEFVKHYRTKRFVQYEQYVRNLLQEGGLHTHIDTAAKAFWLGVRYWFANNPAT
jgi:hypothetical protein